MTDWNLVEEKLEIQNFLEAEVENIDAEVNLEGTKEAQQVENSDYYANVKGTKEAQQQAIANIQASQSQGSFQSNHKAIISRQTKAVISTQPKPL